MLFLNIGCLSIDADALTQTETATPPSSTQWTNVYLIFNQEEDNFVNLESLADNILVVTTIEQAVEAFSASPPPRILYLHPNVLEEIDSEWLRELYRNGIIIAAINTLASQLGQKLGIHTDINDLKMEYLTGDRIIVSAFQRLYDPKQGTQANRITTDYFENFDHASQAFNLMAEMIENPFSSFSPLPTTTPNKID
ncbi:hypothetical protein MNBD_CHLOROFLEXI01-5380 [hydrothermal vent metagenome]|uniref:Uncharacterized protein n=1 Tax=hydrothermal vent metagenome TaxID=652676 RepID=A0A3B0V3L3_9ZZZZ